jgi:hypothetical protein
MPGAFTSFLGTIPDGRAGIKATLKLMVQIARKTRATLPVRIRAQQLIQGCAVNDHLCEAASLQAWVRDHIRYVRDVRDVETIQFPEQTLQLQSGDCDDMALLLAAMLESVGFATRFCAVGMDGLDYSHVLTQVLVPGSGWMSAEVIPIDGRTQKAPFGWFPPNATCFTLAHV